MLPEKLRIAVTTGDPAGIGPEIMYGLTACAPSVLPLHARCDNRAALKGDEVLTEIVLLGDKDLLTERMCLYKDDFILEDFDAETFRPSDKGHLSVLHIPTAEKAVPGVYNKANAPYVLQTLDTAIAGCMSGLFDALVTAPISKSVIASLGKPFTGHTEYLQEKAGCDEVVMMLGCDKMNVALVTTHLPLKDIAQAVTGERLEKVIRILHKDLKERLGFDRPVIYVCGLNPHAGEDGTLGSEEKEVIIPILEKLREEGMILKGPCPADTVFQPHILNEAAAVLSMYHDQGLPVLKYAGFNSGYNTTLGLPFIRTSVDHGTAPDLAGKGEADTGSLQSAVSLALYMAYNKKR